MTERFGTPPLFNIPPLGDAGHHSSQGRQPPPYRASPYPQAAPYHQERSALGEVMTLILGIPADELTPRSREALERLIAEAGRLKEAESRLTARVEYLDLLAHRCETTKLLNRRGMARELSRLAGQMDLGGQGGTFVLMHLDGFEEVRRAHGLAAADAARHHAAGALSAGLRLSDLVASLGGGDMAVFLALAHGEEAAVKAGVLADRLNSPPFLWNDRPHPFTIAIGLAEMRPDSGLRSLIAEADADLRRMGLKR